MAGERAKGGKKNRKHSRQKNKPCQKRYTGEMRWLKNKAKNWETKNKAQTRNPMIPKKPRLKSSPMRAKRSS